MLMLTKTDKYRLKKQIKLIKRRDNKTEEKRPLKISTVLHTNLMPGDVSCFIKNNI